MPAINMNSIMGNVKAYSRSVEGKLRMKECIQKYAKEGRSKTAAGSIVMTEAKMLEAAAKLIWVLQETARNFDLPQSVMQHFMSLTCSKPHQMSDGSTVICVYFEDDLRRESLENGENGYTGEGIDNIVALLNNGTHAKDYVYGWWNGHSPTGEALTGLRSFHTDDYAWVRSKKDRDALHFIQYAVNNFNENYGTDYNVTAIAGDVYK